MECGGLPKPAVRIGGRREKSSFGFGFIRMGPKPSVWGKRKMRTPYMDRHGSGAAGSTVDVRVRPRAGRSRVAGRLGTAIKIEVAQPPEDGRANAEAATVLADFFGVPRRDVMLLSGVRSRAKRFRIIGLTDRQIADRLKVLGG